VKAKKQGRFEDKDNAETLRRRVFAEKNALVQRKAGWPTGRGEENASLGCFGCFCFGYALEFQGEVGIY
jgi:hypothetical protein